MILLPLFAAKVYWKFCQKPHELPSKVRGLRILWEVGVFCTQISLNPNYLRPILVRNQRSIQKQVSSFHW